MFAGVTQLGSRLLGVACASGIQRRQRCWRACLGMEGLKPDRGESGLFPGIQRQWCFLSLDPERSEKCAVYLCIVSTWMGQSPPAVWHACPLKNCGEKRLKHPQEDQGKLLLQKGTMSSLTIKARQNCSSQGLIWKTSRSRVQETQFICLRKMRGWASPAGIKAVALLHVIWNIFHRREIKS